MATASDLIVYSPTETAIATMREKFMPLVIRDLKDTAGYKAVHDARMVIRDARVSVERKRKELKADALEYGRKVDSEAKRITALLEPIETHLQSEESRIDAERQAIKDAARLNAEAEARAKKEAEEAAFRAEQERQAAERRKLDAERRKFAEQQAAQERAAAAERARLEAERRRLADAERERQHAAEVERTRSETAARVLKIDLSLGNETLYAGLSVEEVAGRKNLTTPVAEAVDVVGRNVAAIVAATPQEDRDVVTLTGPMAVWAYLIVFHAVVHVFREVRYEDGRTPAVTIAKHG